MRIFAFILILLTVKYAGGGPIDDLAKNLKEKSSDVACDLAYKAVKGIKVEGFELKFDISKVGFFEGIGKIWKEEIFKNCRLKLTFAFVVEKFKQYSNDLKEGFKILREIFEKESS